MTNDQRHRSNPRGLLERFPTLAARKALPAVDRCGEEGLSGGGPDCTTNLLKERTSPEGVETSYLPDQAAATYRMLAPSKPNFLELNAFHPEYRPGREHYDWNRHRDVWPRVAYVASEAEFLGFVDRYAGERMVCCGLNPRSAIPRNSAGYPRPTREAEISEGRALMLDFDPVGPDAPDPGGLERLLDLSDTYFQDLGLRVPARASSGRGYHLVAAYTPIPAAETTDLKERIRTFTERLGAALGDSIDGAGLRLDGAHDLRRLLKVYGTAKPGGTLSRLLRVHEGEDPALRDYLLRLDVPESEKPADRLVSPGGIKIGKELPPWFSGMLDDQRVADLWHGRGKPKRLDCSRSGYDFSLARLLLAMGRTEPDELATILALRPGGAYINRRRDAGYLRTTIERASQSLDPSSSPRS